MKSTWNVYLNNKKNVFSEFKGKDKYFPSNVYDFVSYYIIWYLSNKQGKQEMNKNEHNMSIEYMHSKWQFYLISNRKKTLKYSKF